MGLEAVKEEILNSAKERANSVIAEARKEAGRVAKEAEKKIEATREKNEAETKKLMDAIKRQELSSAEFENKKMLLEAKKQAIDDVFMGAKKKLEGLDDQKREAYIKKLLEKVKSDIEVGYVYCSKKDARFIKGHKAENIGIIGGLMAENKDMTIRVDYSFETMLQGIKDSELQSISKILFG